MFCSVKKGKYKLENTYKFYLCNRYRDKETRKMKCSDKYIVSLQEEEILNNSISDLRKIIEDSCINKGVNLDNVDLIMTKVNKLKNVVMTENEDTTKEKTEIIQAEIIEECNIDYKTLIMFDVQQEYYKNIKESLNINSLIDSFGGNKKDLFEIEEEELKKIHDKADLINKKIDEIIKEHKEIKKINESLRALNTDIIIIQDIYISCYDKTPTSELWLVGNGYIRDIYRIKDIILPYQKNELKEKYNLADNKLYINYDEFEEIDLYNKSDIKFNKDDITGTLIKIMLSGNCTIEYTTSDVIDIDYNGNSISLSIEHLVDWINNKPTRNYKVDIESLLKYKEQLYKYKIVK